MKKKTVTSGKFKPASADPSDQTSGGFLDDVSGTVMKARAGIFNYGGKGPKTPALLLSIHVDGSDKLSDQALSAGSLKKCRPSKDGKQMLTTGKGFGSRTKIGLFFASLAKVGWPKSKWAALSNDYSALEGLYCQFGQVPMPRITNSDDDSGETKREPQALIVTDIHKLPSENKGFRKRIEALLTDSDEEEDGGEEDEDEDESEDEEDESDESDDSEEEEEEEEEEEDEESDDDEDADEESDDSDDEEEDTDDDEESEDEESSVSPVVAKETSAAIVKLLANKKHSKGISTDDVAPLVFQLVKASKNKRKIVELVQDDDWLKGKHKGFKLFKGKLVKAA